MSPVPEVPFQLEGAQGIPIHGVLRLAPDRAPRPLLLICHGFKGFKDWGFFPYLSRSLAELGIPNGIFNFSHSGVEGDGETFSRLDLFRKNTWEKELFDLRAVMGAAARGDLPEPGAYDGSALRLLGHSRGGGVALLGAAGEPWVERVATIAAISHGDRFSDEVKRKWRRDGVVTIWNLRTRQEMPMDLCFLEDFEENREAYSIEMAARSLRVPLLVIHGESDDSVPVAEGREIASWVGEGGVETEIIPDCNHVLNSGHPFPGIQPTLERAIQAIANFLG